MSVPPTDPAPAEPVPRFSVTITDQTEPSLAMQIEWLIKAAVEAGTVIITHHAPPEPEPETGPEPTPEPLTETVWISFDDLLEFLDQDARVIAATKYRQQAARRIYMVVTYRLAAQLDIVCACHQQMRRDCTTKGQFTYQDRLIGLTSLSRLTLDDLKHIGMSYVNAERLMWFIEWKTLQVNQGEPSS